MTLSRGNGPDVQRLREFLDYTSDNGEFRWRVQRAANRPVGSLAGRIDSGGYRQITIEGVAYRAARLAWLYVHNEWPVADIDHINRNRLDDRICNLRPATRQQNCYNRKIRRDNKLGLTGIYKIEDRYRALIVINKKRHHLGYFKKLKDAKAAYQKAAIQHFGDYVPDYIGMGS